MHLKKQMIILVGFYVKIMNIYCQRSTELKQMRLSTISNEQEILRNTVRKGNIKHFKQKQTKRVRIS